MDINRELLFYKWVKISCFRHGKNKKQSYWCVMTRNNMPVHYEEPGESYFMSQRSDEGKEEIRKYYEKWYGGSK